MATGDDYIERRDREISDDSVLSTISCSLCFHAQHTDKKCTALDCKCSLVVVDEREGNLGEVIDRRVQVYGDPVDTFVDISKVWSGICGFEIQPATVPLMMVGMKAVRARVMPDYSDNSDDIDGYMDIFRKLVGDDMIHARTVAEFIACKWPEQG